MECLTEVRIKVKNVNLVEVKEVVEKIREIEKEYSCNCTLLEIESSAI